MGYIKFIIFILIAILISVFAANNDQSVSISLYPLPYEFSASFFLIIFICLLIGVLVGGTALSFKAYYWKRAHGSAKVRAEKLEAKLNQSESKDIAVK